MSQTAILVRKDAQDFSLPWSFKNKIINGDMRIDQRNSGAAQTITAAAALAYTVDRWYAYCTGANVTGQRVAGANTTQYNYKFTGAASVTAIGFAQRIESYQSYSLASTTATLSVDLANSLLTTVTWTAYYANSTDTFGTLASPTKTSFASGTFTVSSTITRYSVPISMHASSINGVEIVFTVGAQTSGTWTIGNVQLEAGTVATSYESKPQGVELAMCQRYYFRHFPNVNAAQLLPYCWATSATNAYGQMQFPVPLRATPSTLDQSGVAADYRVTFGTTTTVCSSVPTFTSATPYFAQVTLTTASGLTLGQAGVCIAAAASSAGYFGWSAEL